MKGKGGSNGNVNIDNIFLSSVGRGAKEETVQLRRYSNARQHNCGISDGNLTRAKEVGIDDGVGTINGTRESHNPDAEHTTVGVGRPCGIPMGKYNKGLNYHQRDAPADAAGFINENAHKFRNRTNFDGY